MNNLINTVNHIYKSEGGVISDLSEKFATHNERPFARVFVQRVALFVSASWLMASAPLVLTSCSDVEPFATPDAVEARTDTPSDAPPSDSTHTPDTAPDTGSSFDGEISDWKEGKGEVTPAK